MTGRRWAKAAACAGALAWAAECGAQEATATLGGGENPITALPPIEATLKVDGLSRKVTLVGRSQTRIAFSDAGQQKLLPVEKVEEARFVLTVDRVALIKALVKRQWDAAVQALLPGVRPALPYLDLANNNAAQYVRECGDYLMRSGDLLMRKAKTPEEEQPAIRKYEAAYAVYKYARKAEWSVDGILAALRGCKCLLAMGKPKTALRRLEEVDEPNPGDRAYGLYWLVKAELDVQKGKFREAMDAAIKSLCFENKDVDTFPDALLISARCYEEMQEWYRARDVYFEVAKIFPKTDWADAAVERLHFIMDKGLTKAEEKTPIENVFFALQEDVNARVEKLFEDLAKAEKGEEDFIDEKYTAAEVDYDKTPPAGKDDEKEDEEKEE